MLRVYGSRSGDHHRNRERQRGDVRARRGQVLPKSFAVS